MGSPVPPSATQAYRDAVWGSKLLTPEQRLVALCYANHAHGGDSAWVVTLRLMEQTGIRSKVTACKVVSALVNSGWLVNAGAHPGHKQRIVYRLAVPAESEAIEVPTTKRARGLNGQYETGPRTGPVHALDRSIRGDETGPRTGPQPVHGVDETGPRTGPDSKRLSKDSLKTDSPRVGGAGATGPQPDDDGLFEAPPQKPKPPKLDHNTDPDFAKFWDVVTVKSAKPAVYKAWLKALKETTATPQLLIERMAAYTEMVRRTRNDRPKYPQGWLTDERWTDQLPEQSGQGAQGGAYRNPVNQDEYDEWTRRGPRK